MDQAIKLAVSAGSKILLTNKPFKNGDVRCTIITCCGQARGDVKAYQGKLLQLVNQIWKDEAVLKLICP